MDYPWKTEKDFFDIHSEILFSKYPFYHATMIGKTKEEFASYIIKRLNLKKTDIVVDLGCGSGYLTSEISKICKCIGITNSEECLKQCRKNYPDTNFQLGNMESFECSEATHYINLESMGYANIEKTFKNAYKNLKSGGVFYSKDVFYFFNESEKQIANRTHWENYFKFKIKNVADYVRIGYETGFKLKEFIDVTDKINIEMFMDSLNHNKEKFEYPFPGEWCHIAGEFTFVKEPC